MDIIESQSSASNSKLNLFINMKLINSKEPLVSSERDTNYLEWGMDLILVFRHASIEKGTFCDS